MKAKLLPLPAGTAALPARIREEILAAPTRSAGARAAARLVVEELADLCLLEVDPDRYLYARRDAIGTGIGVPASRSNTARLLFAGESQAAAHEWIGKAMARFPAGESAGAPLPGRGSPAGTLTLFWRAPPRSKSARAILPRLAAAIGEGLESRERPGPPKPFPAITAGLLASPIGVLVVRGDEHRVEVVNPALEKLAGRIETGKPLTAHAAVHEAIDRVRSTGRVEELTEIPASMVGAEQRTPAQAFLTCSLQRLPGADACVLVLAIDVSAWVEARHEAAEAASAREEALLEHSHGLAIEHARRISVEAASEAKDGFLARITHDLGTPIATLQLWLGVLQESDPQDEVTRLRALSAIRESASAQSKLIDDLLDLSRGLNQKLRLSMQPTVLAEVVASSVAEFQPAAARAGISLGIAPGGAGLVKADRARVRQIVGNLLSNALKFTPAGGHVEVRHLSGKQWLGFEVRDDGVGIERALLADVFSPFRQAEGPTVRSRGGLGLGLAIVRELTRLHGGQVEARSAGPGRGATFRVRLPRV